MPSLPCPSRLLGLLGLLFLSAPGPAPAADSPFAGQWKVVIPQRHEEVSLWIVQIDKQAAGAKILAGLGKYDTTTVLAVKATPKRLALDLVQGGNQFVLSIEPTPTANKRLPGSIRIGSTILPTWLEPTAEKRLDAKKAVRSAAGHEALQKARKLADADKRPKEIRAIAAKHPGDLTPFLAQQILLGDLLDRKAPASAFAAVIADYRKLAAGHGDDMLLGANLDLARHLLAYRPVAELCVDCARSAIKLFRAEHPIEMKVSARLTLAAALEAAGKKNETKAVAEDLARLAAAYLIAFGSTEETKLRAQMHVATALLGSPADAVSELGLVYARMAVEKLDTETPTAQRVAAYALLLRAARRHGKNDEAAKTQALLDFFEGQLDEAYRKGAIPFEVTLAPPRKGKSTRVVLVELFTTSEARPSIAADIAFDAAQQAFRPEEALFLRYHVPVNAPDLLASPAAQARRKFYSAEIEESVPAALVDGQMTPALGGSTARAKGSFDLLRKGIDSAREKAAGANLALEVHPSGKIFSVQARVTNLGETGDKVRLRLLLVEDEVRHVGASGRRLHGQVVRGFLGNANGIKLDRKDSTHKATLDVDAVRKALAIHLEEQARKGNLQGDIPLEMKSLSLVAFVQHEESKKVYQAARIALPAKK